MPILNDTQRDAAVALGDRIWDWAVAVPVRDVALAMVRYSTEGLDALFPLDEASREALLETWLATLGRMDRVKVAELGAYLDCCPEMPR